MFMRNRECEDVNCKKTFCFKTEVYHKTGKLIIPIHQPSDLLIRMFFESINLILKLYFYIGVLIQEHV